MQHALNVPYSSAAFGNQWMQRAASKINKYDAMASAMTKIRVKFQICWSSKTQECEERIIPMGKSKGLQGSFQEHNNDYVY